MKKKYITHSETRDFLGSHGLFTDLPEETLDGIARISNLSSYKKGDGLFFQGDQMGYLSIIKEGWIRLYRGNADGEEGTARISTCGELLGERAALSGTAKHFFSAQAVSTATILNLPSSGIRDTIRKNPVILGRIIGRLTDKIGQLHIESEQAALFSAPQRVSCLLLRLSSYMIGNGGTFRIPYDKSLAAAQLGMKRETFSRALASLRSKGVSVKGSEISISSFAQLSKSCCLSCPLNGECAGARAPVCAPTQKAANTNKTISVNPEKHRRNFHGS